MSQTPNTLIIGKVLHHLENCLSTNSHAKELLAKSKPLEGTVIITDNQTDGRGQFGNSWQSEAGQNIALSAILYPKLSVNQQFYLSKAASLACVNALKSITNLDFEIKWPNDIFYGNQKVGGLLIENQLMGNQISNCVVGIGINLNQEAFDNLPHAASIIHLVCYVLNRKKFTEILLEHLDSSYLMIHQGNLTALDEAYFAHLKSYKEEFKYKENGVLKTALLKGVNPQGQLEVVEDGKDKLFNFKEIEWLLEG